MKKRPDISSVEWWLVIGVLGSIDLLQVLLDLLAGVGIVINRFIDGVVAMALPFYLKIRGQEVFSQKKLMGFVGAFVGEMIPGVDALPLWSLDGLYFMYLYKLEKKEEEIEEQKEKQAKEQKIIMINRNNRSARIEEQRELDNIGDQDQNNKRAA